MNCDGITCTMDEMVMVSEESTHKRMVWEVYAGIAPRLVKLGFEPARSGVYRLPISDEVTGWITPGTVHMARGAGILPTVSLMFESIERMRAAIDAHERHPDQHTFGRPLYSLMTNPMKDNTWEFFPGDNALVLDDLVAAIEIFALPYLRNFTDLHSLRRYLDEGHSFPNVSYVLPMTQYATGDVPSTRHSLSRSLNKAERTGSPIYAETYREFARNFEQFIDARESPKDRA